VISPKFDDGDEELDELFGDEEPEGASEQSAQDFFSGGDSYNRHDDGTELSPESSPKSPESRQIRRTFLRMAEIFHPDKVTDPETRMRHNEIMKEVNRAYKEGDIAKLLEIERQYQWGILSRLKAHRKATSNDSARGLKPITNYSKSNTEPEKRTALGAKYPRRRDGEGQPRS